VALRQSLNLERKDVDCLHDLLELGLTGDLGGCILHSSTCGATGAEVTPNPRADETGDERHAPSGSEQQEVVFAECSEEDFKVHRRLRR
jgi:hypothetical protein